MIDKRNTIIKGALLLQLIWYVMFVTNFIGFIGSKSILLQDIVWIGIPSIGLVVSLLFLLKYKLHKLSFITMLLSLPIFAFWFLISGISEM
ncbi:hypothetical protein [Guptibacillus spartinae]|uniref:hypothetical protein n=1 Tax=Guptibacillus spartinae TaxID=3025679 RepID=UPI002362ED5E|nr:hypothetical protein [Pseudalkalibacillus spartinae]